jgi:hypothetical protein
LVAASYLLVILIWHALAAMASITLGAPGRAAGGAAIQGALMHKVFGIGNWGLGMARLTTQSQMAALKAY